jgi:excisionase family DNA binding protein
MIILRLRKFFFRCIKLRMENVLLSTKQVAERLGVSVPRIRQMILAGQLPTQQIGRDHLIKESDLALVKTYGKAGRPKKEGAAEADQVDQANQVQPKAKRAKAEQQTLPAIVPAQKKPATKPTAQKTKAVATKKGGKL